MYQRTYVSQIKQRARRKRVALLLAFTVILAVMIGGTVAYLNIKTEPVKNTFKAAKVSCEVVEHFENNIKTKVNVKNTGNINAYLRVKLISYRVDGEDNHRIGGKAEIPAFTPGENWVPHDGYYYYTLPVAPDQKPKKDLIESIDLKSYEDVDGGRQVIEVMAEAIQSVPDKAVGEAWGVKISPNKVEQYPNGGGNE